MDERNVAYGFHEYQKKARQTAMYPAEHRHAYVYYGLVGEVGEFANKVKKVLRGDYSFEKVRKDLIDELGDICWYVACYCYEHDIDMSPCVTMEDEDFYTLYESLDSLIGDLTLFSGDENPYEDLPPERACDDVAFALLSITNLAKALDVTIQDVYAVNLKKLQDRKHRHVIQGSGDTR